MFKYAVAVVLAGAAAFAASPPQAPTCLHDAGETADQQTRREAALQFAQTLNKFEAVGKSQAQSYYNISDLPGLPPLPEGFTARLSTDGASYAFLVKDTLDACRFAYFSDQDRVIYTGTPVP